MADPLPYESRDNEFIAWYPNALSAGDDRGVWRPNEAAFYVHIPFCDQICDYCGFSVERLKRQRVTDYLAALETEIEMHARNPFMATKRFTVGHFGGGTPSVLEPDEIARILERIGRVIDVRCVTELTLEANPISLTSAKAHRYRKGGITRLSLGIQSFNSALLRSIGRPHRPDEAIRTFEAAREAGYDNISIDLMFGLPGQGMGELLADLGQAVRLGPEHISCFSLEYIPFTPLALKRGLGLLNGSPVGPSELLAMHELVSSYLEDAGYMHYGAMNFSRPGRQSEHNRIAFMAPQGEYIGWGNSAYSYMNEHVFCNHADIDTYVAAINTGRSPVAFVRRASGLELASRFIVLGLKFLHVSREAFESRFGVPMDHYFSSQIAKLRAQGLIVADEQGLSLSPLGVIFVNNVCKEFYVEPNRNRLQYVQYVPTITAETINHLSEKARRRSRPHE